MSDLLKHMAIITDNKWAARAKEIATLEKFITDHGYRVDDIMSAVFLCWFNEFDEISEFPKDSLVPTAKALVDIVGIVVADKNLKIINILYSNAIRIRFRTETYPKAVLDILEKNMERYCLIINNTCQRIIHFKENHYQPNKGIITKVIPENELPQDVHGNKADICLSNYTLSKNQDPHAGDWKVVTKLSDDHLNVEISAVVIGSHGERSWGWHDDRLKITVLSVHRVYQHRPVSDAIIAQAQKEAQEICDEKNNLIN